MKVLPQVLVNAKVPNNMKNIHEEDKEIIAEIKKMEVAFRWLRKSINKTIRYRTISKSYA